jgi:hypothetical protein
VSSSHAGHPAFDNYGILPKYSGRGLVSTEKTGARAPGSRRRARVPENRPQNFRNPHLRLREKFGSYVSLCVHEPEHLRFTSALRDLDHHGRPRHACVPRTRSAARVRGSWPGLDRVQVGDFGVALHGLASGRLRCLCVCFRCGCQSLFEAQPSPDRTFKSIGDSREPRTRLSSRPRGSREPRKDCGSRELSARLQSRRGCSDKPQGRPPR